MRCGAFEAHGQSAASWVYYSDNHRWVPSELGLVDFQASGSTHSSAGSSFAGLTWDAGHFERCSGCNRMSLSTTVNFQAPQMPQGPTMPAMANPLMAPLPGMWQTQKRKETNDWRSRECVVSVVCSLQILGIQTGWALEPCQWCLQCLVPCLATP